MSEPGPRPSSGTTLGPSPGCLPMTSSVSTGGVWSVIKPPNSRKPSRGRRPPPLPSWSANSSRTHVFESTVTRQFLPRSTLRTFPTQRSVTVERPCGCGVRIGGSVFPFMAAAFWNDLCRRRLVMCSERHDWTGWPIIVRQWRSSATPPSPLTMKRQATEEIAVDVDREFAFGSCSEDLRSAVKKSPTSLFHVST